MILKSEYVRFYEYLKETYPITNCPSIVFSMRKAMILKKDGTRAFGVVKFRQNKISISVVLARSHALVMKVIAHEYRHVIQKYTMAPMDSETKEELDAQLFGEQEVRNFKNRIKNDKQEIGF